MGDCTLSCASYSCSVWSRLDNSPHFFFIPEAVSFISSATQFPTSFTLFLLILFVWEFCTVVVSTSKMILLSKISQPYINWPGNVQLSLFSFCVVKYGSFFVFLLIFGCAQQSFSNNPHPTPIFFFREKIGFCFVLFFKLLGCENWLVICATYFHMHGFKRFLSMLRIVICFNDLLTRLSKARQRIDNMIPSSPSSVAFVHKGIAPFFECVCNCYVCIVYIQVSWKVPRMESRDVWCLRFVWKWNLRAVIRVPFCISCLFLRLALLLIQT